MGQEWGSVPASILDQGECDLFKASDKTRARCLRIQCAPYFFSGPSFNISRPHLRPIRAKAHSVECLARVGGLARLESMVF
jgi:hypothetical protein